MEMFARDDVGAGMALPGDTTGDTKVPFTPVGASANAELHTSPLPTPAVPDPNPLPGLPPPGSPGDDAADLIPSILCADEPCHEGRGLDTTRLLRLDCIPLVPAPAPLS